MLGLWAYGVGVLRLVHLSRASPRRLARSTFHFDCGRGKQKGNRHGFDFAIPGYLMSGWDWASRWLEDWQDLPASKRATSGLNFSEHGVPYTTPQTVRIAQDLFTPLLGGSVAALTSYSFRRVGPTYVTLAGWTPQNQLALGDWQDKTRAKEQGNTMPLRYSGTRYTTSVRRKHFLLTAVAGLLKYNRWDEIPSKVLEATEREGTLGMDRAVQQDNHTKWQGQICDDEMALRFRLPSVVPLPVAGHAMMPRQIGGKRLSATLRDGVLLCAAFQSGNCATRGDSCADGRHRCAVLLQSGRICGGTHGAGECRVKRAIQAPESPPRTGTRAKAAPVVLRPKAKGKGQPEVKAMPKPKKMSRDA